MAIHLENQARAFLISNPKLTKTELADLLQCSVTTIKRLTAWRERNEQDAEDYDPFDILDWATESVDKYHKIVKRDDTLRWESPLGNEPIAILNFSDAHAFSFHTNHELISRDLKIVRDNDNVFMIGLGDFMQGITAGFPAAEPALTQFLSPEAQIKVFTKMFQQLKDKIIFLHSGNHERFTARSIGFDVFGLELSKYVPVFEGIGLSFITVGDQRYSILSQHKARGRSKTNKTLGCANTYLKDYPADIVLSGHTHAFAMYWDSHYAAAKLVGDNFGGDRLFINCATYQEIKSDYARMLGGAGGEYASPTVVLFPGERRMVAFKYVTDALVFLRGLKAIKENNKCLQLN